MASAPKGLTADNTSASRRGVRTTSKRIETAELLAVPGDRRRCAAAQKASRARRAGAALWLAGRLRLPQTVGAAFQPAPHLAVEPNARTSDPCGFGAIAEDCKHLALGLRRARNLWAR